MERTISLIKKASPKIAELFGLKPTFVTVLLIILSAICMGIYQLNITQQEQNKMLREQLSITNEFVKEINSKVSEHDKRIVILESKVENNHGEWNIANNKTADALARLETKLDMVTYDVRQLNSYTRRK